MENTGIIQEFAAYLRNVKNRSELTVSSYMADIRQFCRILGVEDFSEVTRRDVESKYISALVKDGLAASSRARKLSSLKCFFKWAKANNYVVENPVENVESPKIPHREPKIMSRDEVDEVMVAVRSDGNSEAAIFRDTTILSLLFNTGIRRAELTNIKLKDIDLQDGSILIFGKGQKFRRVYMNDTTRAIISEYILSHRKLLKKSAESQYLFCSRQSEKLSLVQVNNILGKHFKAAGLEDKGYTVHSTRKAFAAECYRQTGDVFAVQKLLGHQNTQTTMIYIGAAEDSKRAAACAVNF